MLLDRFIEPEQYWRIKGYGRLLLLAGIFVYGIGLLLKRIHAEREQARPPAVLIDDDE